MTVSSTPLRRWLGDLNAQALVEFALIAPILIFLLFGIFTVGYWMNAQQIVTLAARQGLRVGVLTNDNGQITGAIRTNMAFIDPENDKTAVAFVPTLPDDPARARGNPLTVQVTFTMPFWFEMFPDAFKSVRASVTGMIECVPPPGFSVCS